MTKWHDLVIKEITFTQSSVLIAADPYGLLLHDAIYSCFKKKDIDFVEYENPIRFRLLYEEEYRERIKTESVKLLIRVPGDDMNIIPYDIYKKAHIVHLSYLMIFPDMSVQVVKSLPVQQIDALFEAYPEYTGTQSEKDTIEFILKKVYKVPYDTMSTKDDFVSFLLMKHYQRIYFPEMLRKYLADYFKDKYPINRMNINELIESPESFYQFLQAQWEKFVDMTIINGERELVQNPSVASVGSMFLRPDIWSLIDNLFVERKLTPVKHEDAGMLPVWMRPGLCIDETQDKKERVEELLLILNKNIRSTTTHKDWAHIMELYCECHYLSDDTNSKPEWLEKVNNTLQQVDETFYHWIQEKYIGLKNYPFVPQPVMVHHIPHYLAHVHKKKTALIIMDGMSGIQWIRIKNILSEQGRYNFKENCVFAWVPTVTSVSRQAIFSGMIPKNFEATIKSNNKEETQWRKFWQDHGVYNQYIHYCSVDGQTRFNHLDILSNPKNKVLGMVIRVVDDLLHGAIQGQEGIAAELNIWMRKKYLSDFISKLLALEYDVFLTSDHGNVESIGIGKATDGAIPDYKGQRVRVYQSLQLYQNAEKEYNTIEWNTDGLPKSMFLLLAGGRDAFIPKKKAVCHGSTHIQEVMVPFVQIENQN